MARGGLPVIIKYKTMKHKITKHKSIKYKKTKYTPFDAGISRATANFQIPATAKFCTVPVNLRTGQACVITGSGVWLSHPHGSEGWCGVGGNGIPAALGHTVPGAGEGCLVVFRNGQVVDHFTTDNQQITISGPGQVGFGCNDDNFLDNQGAITVYLDF